MALRYSRNPEVGELGIARHTDGRGNIGVLVRGRVAWTACVATHVLVGSCSGFHDGMNLMVLAGEVWRQKFGHRTSRSLTFRPDVVSCVFRN